MSKAPERIWLQDAGDYDSAMSSSDDVTWCVSPVDDRDTEYIRADLCFTADDLRRVFAIAIEMAGDTAKSIRLDYDAMKPHQITHEPMRVQRVAKGMVRIAEDDIRALTPPDDLLARVREPRDE